MLKITVQQDFASFRMYLAGRLADAWVTETEKTWYSAPSSVKRVEIDMREVTWVDRSGRRLLQAMHNAGAHLITEGVAMTALIEEIQGANR